MTNQLDDGSNSEQREIFCRSKSIAFALLAASSRRCFASSASVEHHATPRANTGRLLVITRRRRWYPTFTTDDHRHLVPEVVERRFFQPTVGATPKSKVRLVRVRRSGLGRSGVACSEISSAPALRRVRSFVAAVDHVIVVEVNEVTAGTKVAGSGFRCRSKAGTVDRVRVRRALVQELDAGVGIGSLSPAGCSSCPVDDGRRTPGSSRLELLYGGGSGGGEGGRHHCLGLG